MCLSLLRNIQSSNVSKAAKDMSVRRDVLPESRSLHEQFSPFFSVLHYPLGLGELQADPSSDVVFPPLFLSALSSSPFHWAFQDGIGLS